ncbi:MAG: MerR family transcriptional regulator [Nitrospinae bacterium]|nr:MerR family transcriptional regulator [Nitrospinota bacterium]
MAVKETNPRQDSLPVNPAPPERMFYKIRDVAKIAGVKPHVLRYWESEFPTLNPQKNRNGQRVYTKKDLDTALSIKRLLHDEKYSIAGARQALKKKRGPGDEISGVDALAIVRTELSDLLELLNKTP